nr:unnamed protein product [Spirometra erinaceieuropaei]
MSIILRSSVQCGPIFLRAFTAWVAGDICNAQNLCLHCLQSLRHNGTFPHLAFCLYIFAMCVQQDSNSTHISDLIECLRSKGRTGAMRVSLPWHLLESFDGTASNFLSLARRSAASDKNDPATRDCEFSLADPDDDENRGSPTPWDDHLRRFTSTDLENLALFCLDWGLSELGVDFAVQAHVLSRLRDSPEPESDSVFEDPLPSISCYLSKRLGIRQDNDFSIPAEDDNSSLDEQEDSGTSLSLLLNSPRRPRVSTEPPVSATEDQEFTERPSTPPASFEPCHTRRRTPFSILKSSSVGNMDAFAERPQSSGDLPKSGKHVRFSLSSLHPPPDVEDENGGRSNRRRLMDFARRQGWCLDPDAYESGGGTIDRFVTLFWPLQQRSIYKFTCELLSICLFITLILTLTVLFLSLIICVPLVWLSAPVSPTTAASFGVDTCFRLFDILHLRNLIS